MAVVSAENIEVQSAPSNEKPSPKPVEISAKCLPSEITLRLLSAQLLSLLLIYGTLWGGFQENALPGSSIFALFLLIVSCFIGGKLVRLIRLPPLIGMLLTGFMYRNLPFIPYSKDIPDKWTASLRSSALAVILLHAGLGLSPAVLKRLSLLCFRLSSMPCIAEAVSVGISAHFLLGLPWAWGFSLGFVLGAVSPAIIIPMMLLLQIKGYGHEKGIATLIIASSSIDDVFAIAGFGVCIGIGFSTGNLAWTLLKGPLEVLIGLTFGGAIGVLCWYFPHVQEKHKVFYRIILLLFGGFGATFMSQALDLSAAGPLACLGLSFVAAIRWREEEDNNASVGSITAGIWKLFQTVLFGLIGAEVSVADLEKDIGYGLLILFFGLVFRLIVTYICLFGSDFNVKEKLFVALAWLPKATVQAAIGSVALDLARFSNLGSEYIMYGKSILTISVLSILLTAPLGAVAIALLGPLLLQKTQDKEARRSVVDIVNEINDLDEFDIAASMRESASICDENTV